MTSKKDEIVPVVIYSGTQGEIDILISLLENAEIPVYLRDGYAGTIIPYSSPGAANPISVVVSSEDEERARQVVEEFVSNQKK
ncbi:MAG: DUF2007 domain-containing protein [Chlorobi bacterium]|nr:DUF2007 domain-containing protein [Chlorobiota bacterium]